MAKQKVLISGNKLSDLSNYKDLQFMSWNSDKNTGEVLQNEKGLYTANVLSLENEMTIGVKVRQNPMQMNLKKGDSVDLVGLVTVVPYAGKSNGNFTPVEMSITGDRLEKKTDINQVNQQQQEKK